VPNGSVEYNDKNGVRVKLMIPTQSLESTGSDAKSRPNGSDAKSRSNADEMSKAETRSDDRGEDERRVIDGVRGLSAPRTP
jgi:hypothetical protein